MVASYRNFDIHRRNPTSEELGYTPEQYERFLAYQQRRANEQAKEQGQNVPQLPTLRPLRRGRPKRRPVGHGGEISEATQQVVDKTGQKHDIRKWIKEQRLGKYLTMIKDTDIESQTKLVLRNWEEYLRSSRSYSENTIVNYMYSIGWLVMYAVLETISPLKFSDVDASNFKMWLITELKRSGRFSAINVNTIILRTRMFYEFLIRQKIINFNPFRQQVVEPLRIKRDITVKSVTLEQFNDVFNAATRVDIQLAMALCYYAGLRISEALNVKSSDISEYVIGDKRTLKIRVTGKGDKVRDTLVLSSDGVALIEKLMTTKGLSIDGGDANLVDYPKRKTLCNIAILLSNKCFGEPGVFTFHRLRHSYGHTLARLGLDIVKIAHLMGHTNIQTTRIYAEPQTEDIAKEILSHF